MLEGSAGQEWAAQGQTLLAMLRAVNTYTHFVESVVAYFYP